MITLTRMFIMISIFFSQCLFVASAEDSASLKDYVKVCTENQNNKMDHDLCECMGNEGKKLSEEEFDFFYAIAAKNQEKVNKGHATLDPNQKVNVMQLTMMGPSKCANKLAAQQNSSDTPDNSDSASESTNDAASATVSESANSASQ